MASSPSLPVPSPASSYVKVKTTWPTVPPNTDRSPIRTGRLLLRPFVAADAEAVYELRKQPEVMRWTIAGVVDDGVDASRVWVERFLSPKDLETYNFAILYPGDNAESEGGAGVLIGTAGAHKVHHDLGWPEVGYMFRKEFWNKGLGTEFLRAFTKAWWALPRREIELVVDAASVEKRGNFESNNDDVIRVPEVLTAYITASNTGSRRVLEKAGFREYKRWTEPNHHAGFEGTSVTLVGFLLEAPDS
ncbi:acetyltransferase domain-containing protein [Xylaria palmicola]|nr:acetyltransferase domain-containing protein [Xylaria palmicola]